MDIAEAVFLGMACLAAYVVAVLGPDLMRAYTNREVPDPLSIEDDDWD